MRILVLTTLYPNPLQPNRATFNRQQFRALAVEHELQVIAPIAWTDEWSQHRRPGSTERQRICDGIVVHHPRYLFTPKILRSHYGGFFARSVRDCFWRVISNLQPEVVLGCWAYPDGWAAGKLGREAGLPVALKIHGSDVLSLDQYPGRRQRTTEALAEADAVVAVSRDLARQAIALGADQHRVNVVYNGVDTSLFRPGSKDAARLELGLSSGDSLILFIGNLVSVKNIESLLDALALIAGGGRRFKCALIGDGPLRKPLQRRAAILGIGDQVQFIGSRPQAELPAWYRAADLLVLPSCSEGVPNVLLEATACGTPFIASRVGGIPEIAPEEAMVDPSNAAALADRIRRFLADGDGTLRSPPRVDSWSDSSRALAAVLRGIVSKRSVQRKRIA